DLLREYFTDDSFPDVKFYRGRGCLHCRQTGFLGQIAFHELVIINDEMRAIISRDGSLQSLREAAIRNGYRPRRYDGLKKVLLGQTTIEEIERLTVGELAPH